MKLMYVALAAGLISSSTLASEVRTIKIVGAGENSARAFQARQAEIEKASGAPLEFQRYRATLAVSNLSKGVVDAFTGPRIDGFSEMIEAEYKAQPIQLSDYRAVEIRKLEVNIAVHPENPVQTLTKEQLTGIFNGTITNWKEITGKDAPIEAYLPLDKAFLTIAMQEALIAGQKHKILAVKDHLGQIRHLKRNPNAIAIVTEVLTDGDFKPKHFPAGVTFSNYITIRKDARPEVQKMIDWVEANMKPGAGGGGKK